MNEPPWRPGTTRRPKPDRSGKTQLTRAEIVQTALRIVQAEGIAGVSMRRVAAEFDTGPSSLYAHVTNKDELLQLMFEEVCGLVPVPELDPPRWKEQIRELARAGHQALCHHNDLARASLATIPTGPNALRVSNAMMGMMLAGGVPPKIAAWAMDRIFLYITADAYESSLWRAGSGGDAFAEELTDDLVGFFEQIDGALYPHIREHARTMVSGGGTERFELGLELLVDGLDKYTTRE
jgi:AcrR family transcriptional regulator